MRKGGRTRIFLLHRRYLAIALGLLLAAAMLLAACLPELLAQPPAPAGPAQADILPAANGQ